MASRIRVIEVKLRGTGEEHRRRECKVEESANQREGRGVVLGEGAGVEVDWNASV